jgi:hypothetical protein
MTEEERAAFAAHAEWLGRLLADGSLILAAPTLGPVNTGIGIFEGTVASGDHCPRRPPPEL